VFAVGCCWALVPKELIVAPGSLMSHPLLLFQARGKVQKLQAELASRDAKVEVCHAMTLC
jgi:hypothetical protein